MSNTEDWIYKLFVEKGLLYLRVLNKMWEKAGEEAFNIKRLLDSLGVKEGSLVLDLGCGNGRIAINLAKLGYKVYGVDISPVFIKDALEKARLYNVEDKTFFKTCDVRRIDEEFDKNKFDVVFMYWSTILGYYDEDTDKNILRRIRRITSEGGYLLILNTVIYDLAVLRAGVLGSDVSYFNEIDDELVIIERSSFDPVKSVLNMIWLFYKKTDKNLIFIDEIGLRLRIYTLHELIKFAEESGWKYVNAYRDIATLRPYIPLFSGLNIVFKK